MKKNIRFSVLFIKGEDEEKVLSGVLRNRVLGLRAVNSSVFGKRKFEIFFYMI